MISHPPASSGNTPVLIYGLLFAILLALVALLGYVQWMGYSDLKREAQTKTSNYAAVTVARLDATLRRTEARLNRLASQLPDAALDLTAVHRFESEVAARLQDNAPNFVELAGLRVFDAQGNLLYLHSLTSERAPPAHIGDRDYFRRLRDDPRSRIVFTETLRISAGGRQGIGAALALRDAGGVFRGVVLAEIDLDVFEKLFQSLDIGKRGFMMLRRSDDFSAVLRWPAVSGELASKPHAPIAGLQEAIRSGQSEGTLEALTPGDNVIRIVSYRLVPGFPFYVASGLARDEVLAGWRTQTLTVLLVALMLMMLVAGLLFRLWRMGQREDSYSSALRQSELRYRRIVETSQEGIWMIDAEGRTNFVNQRMAAMLGYEVGEMMGRTLFEFMDEEGVSLTEANLERRRQGIAEQHDFKLRHKNGSAVWTLMSTSPVTDDSKAYLGALAMVSDISARKAAEAAVRTLNIELEQRVQERTAELQSANKELETFTYSVSHDLRAPLRAIDGYSNLLLEEYSGRLDEEGRQFLRNVRSAATHMSTLIDDLLAYSKIERREQELSRVTLREIIDGVLMEYESDFKTRSIALIDRVDHDVVVRADRQGLAMAIRNLIGNAIKFSAGAGRPEIEIGWAAVGAATRMWVRDNGVGFDMKYHEQIFLIFKRLHASDKYPGTGVGLAIVRKAMERIGGRAWAESEPGKGATFYLEIPQ